MAIMEYNLYFLAHYCWLLIFYVIYNKFFNVIMAHK